MLFRRGRSGAAERFEPVKLLPLTTSEKERLIKGADSLTKVYEFSFRLSAKPSPKWLEVFQAQWYRQYGGETLPRFGGDAVRLSCAIGDLQNTVSALRLVADEANRRCEALFNEKFEHESAERREREEAKRAAERAMGDAIDNLKI